MPEPVPPNEPANEVGRENFTEMSLLLVRRPASTAAAAYATRRATRRVATLALPDKYDALVESGVLRHDAAQRKVSQTLEALKGDLVQHAEATAKHAAAVRAWERQLAALQKAEADAAAARLAEERRRFEEMPAWRRGLWTLMGYGVDFETVGRASGSRGASDRGGSGSVGEDGLTDEERKHPFWTSGIGAAALRRRRGPSDGTCEGTTASPSGAAPTDHEPPAARMRLPAGMPPPPPLPPPPPRGVFIHGDVGGGKTLLMDLFADDDALRAAMPVRRVHFNAFIAECHKRLHAHSKAIAEQLRIERQRASSERRGSGTADAGSAANDDAAATASDGALQQRQQQQPQQQPWHAITAMVRRLISERDADADDGKTLSAALDSISHGILVSDEMTPRTTPADDAALSEPSVVDHPTSGQPISAGVLCFDEVQMMDIADATIVAGVLDRLFSAGWVLVATCNRTPEEFASSTLHKEHPQARFTERILELCDRAVLSSPSPDGDGSPIDYRTMLRPATGDPTYLAPHHDPHIATTLEGTFARELRGAEAVPTRAEVGPNRCIELLASPSCGVARCSFAALCDSALGASDYIALAEQYHTVFLTDVPQLSLQRRDEARRFITLIDQLYNHRTKLVASAEVPLDALFHGTSSPEAAAAQALLDLEGVEFEGEAGKAEELNPIGVTANRLDEAAAAQLGASARVGADTRKRLAQDSLFTGEDEVFAFRRAVSRLTEMQSVEYLGRAGAARKTHHSS